MVETANILKETNIESDSISEYNFKWGTRDGPEISSAACREIVHWRPKFFQVPSGTIGKTFVTEIACLYQTFADKSSLECISIRAMQYSLPGVTPTKAKQRQQSIGSPTSDIYSVD